LEKLGVLPQFRRRGFGKALVQHALAEAEAIGAYRVEVGIISAQAELRKWYRSLGFTETGTARFAHLPFEVMFMAKGLEIAG
jgi:ribosomal protein S18 acetylase RimI-like enzyme